MTKLKTGKEVGVLGEVKIKGESHYIVELKNSKFIIEGALSRYVMIPRTQFEQNVEFITPITP